MIAPTSFFSDYGGHIRILEETRALQARGVEVAIVTYYKGNDVPGLDIRRTAPLPWHTDYEVGSSRHKIAFDAYLAVKAATEARRFRPDVIHGHMHEGALIGGALARARGVPLVFDFQGSLTAEMVDHHFLNPHGALYPWAYRLESAITRGLPDAILTSSGRAATLLRDEFDVPAERIHTLPDCADADHFDPARFTHLQADHPLRVHYGIAREAVVVGYLGLLTDYQGIPHLIEAAARLKEQGRAIHFLIMGYPNVESYQMAAHAWGVAECVTFTGRVPFADAPNYLAACDITVAPKMSSSEGSGKLLNYMAMAQPIVAYDTPVNREYLDDLGVYAPPGDVAAFTAAIAELAEDAARRRTLGAALRRRAQEEFSWPVAAERILNLYNRLTNEGD
ncbi:MAG: glycosyltransferase family 4 protein [Candidatus Promineofilum sp.]|nr:glycosyltransferase family 4 protein [Promineifilum sp.]